MECFKGGEENSALLGAQGMLGGGGVPKPSVDAAYAVCSVGYILFL